ncbi:MAG: hypothetical protein UV80_C0001G0049 [Candidatus Peregrinibacteria bacterium GW2011_GWF2_43_17]|nr:MAG: hypothetical protein UV80_C0001G0049 [Candidatus Peregrinibacteria bacterium GW2011_GWF2_43_17]HAU40291.1 RNHCP domain-containing protein [Candidatus Peregrinibacteria bacterium]
MKTPKINEKFVCKNCGTLVPPSKSSCRNHCTKCLHSMHVDETLPGDRLSPCHGLMEPIGLEYKGNKGYQIIHKCLLCGKKQLNMAADDDNQEEVAKINLRTL